MNKLQVIEKEFSNLIPTNNIGFERKSNDADLLNWTTDRTEFPSGHEKIFNSFHMY